MEQIKSMFSSKIYDLRKHHNLTQEQASEKLDTSPRGFQKWEGGDTLPDFIHILHLAYVLNFDVYAFAEEVFSNGLLQAPKG